MTNMSQDNRRVVREQQVTPAEMGHGLRESDLVLAENGMLNKCPVILLVHRHEHAHDISHQVCTALGHTIKENRLEQTFLCKICVQLVEVVRLRDDSWHWLFPAHVSIGSRLSV